MVKKPLIAGVCTLVLFASGIAVYLSGETRHVSEKVGQPAKTDSVTAQTNNYTSQPHIQQQYKANRELVTDISIWEESEKAREVLQSQPEKLPGDLAEEAYIELDTKKIKNMELGDQFEVVIPQLGGSLAAEVDYITNHPNGDRTIEANFPGMDKYFSAVFTVGNENTYAQIATPDGVYILEAQGDYAWITSRQALVASHWSGHEDGVMPPADDKPMPENNDPVDVEFDYVIQESSPDDNP